MLTRRSLFRIEVSRVGADVEANLIGELDISGLATLDAELAQLLHKEQPASVTLDCGRLTFIDVVGFEELIRLAHLAEGRIILLDPPPILARMLAVTGVDRVFTIVERWVPALPENTELIPIAGGPLRRIVRHLTA